MALLIGDPVSVADDAYQAIAAAASDEATVHNIFAPEGSAWELYWYDGTNAILIGTYYSSLIGVVLHVQDTSGSYLRVRNVSGASIYLGWSGAVRE